MRKIFFGLVLVLVATTKLAASDATEEKYLDLNDNGDKVIAWVGLFTKLNLILNETTKLREGQNELSESLETLNNRIVTLELKMANLMDDKANDIANLEKRQNEQHFMSTVAIKELENVIKDMKKSQEESQVNSTALMKDLQNELADMKKSQEESQLSSSALMKDLQQELMGLEKSQEKSQRNTTELMEDIQKELAVLKKSQEESQLNTTDLIKDLQKELAVMEKSQEESHLSSTALMKDLQKEMTDLKISQAESQSNSTVVITDMQKELTDSKKWQDSQEHKLTYFMEQYFNNENEWTTILRRQDGSVSFHRNLSEYQKGFGHTDGEFFIGLDKLHNMTSSGAPQELLIILRDFENETRIAKYDLFQIGSETEKYALKELGKYTGNAGDSLIAHKGQSFSTPDHDNSHKCANAWRAGWWFKSCFESNLFGNYYAEDKKHTTGVSWKSWRGLYYSLKFAEMKIRPKIVQVK